jgi:hypothetical protein
MRQPSNVLLFIAIPIICGVEGKKRNPPYSVVKQKMGIFLYAYTIGM